MGWTYSIVWAVAVFGMTLAATPALIRALQRRAVVDRPNRRSSHMGHTVRGGGLALALVASLVVAIAAPSTGLWVVTPALVLALLGFFDDVSSLPVTVRLPVQVATGTIISVLAVTVLDAGGFWLLLGPLWIVGYLNAFNFMDGINGISCTHGGLVGIAWTLAAVLADEPAAALISLVLVAAAAGFLPYNFPVARAFLGDTGSYFLGTWIAVGAVVLSIHIGLLGAVLPTAVYVADTAWTLVRRVRNGRKWSEAHRDHVYQQLVRGGWSHTRTTGLVGAVTTATGGFAVWASTVASLPGLMTLVTLTSVSVCLYLAMPYLVFDSPPGLEPQDASS